MERDEPNRPSPKSVSPLPSCEKAVLLTTLPHWVWPIILKVDPRFKAEKMDTLPIMKTGKLATERVPPSLVKSFIEIPPFIRGSAGKPITFSRFAIFTTDPNSAKLLTERLDAKITKSSTDTD